MFMGVMGYPLRSIMLSHTKETIFQLLLGIPIGFLAGWGILNLVKRAFSGDNFVISAMIYPGSYLIAGIMVVAMAVLMAFVSARHINRLDIVEGLKARDE
jgi:ABC-type antimicrobial peptide transport system permease subunit